MSLAEGKSLFLLLLLFYAPKACQDNSQEVSDSKSEPHLRTQGPTFSFLFLGENSDLLKLSHEESYFKK